MPLRRQATRRGPPAAREQEHGGPARGPPASQGANMTTTKNAGPTFTVYELKPRTLTLGPDPQREARATLEARRTEAERARQQLEAAEAAIAAAVDASDPETLSSVAEEHRRAGWRARAAEVARLRAEAELV